MLGCSVGSLVLEGRSGTADPLLPLVIAFLCQGRKRMRMQIEEVGAASAFSQLLLQSRPAGGKRSRWQRLISSVPRLDVLGRKVAHDIVGARGWNGNERAKGPFLSFPS